MIDQQEQLFVGFWTVKDRCGVKMIGVAARKRKIMESSGDLKLERRKERKSPMSLLLKVLVDQEGSSYCACDG
jgi:hypothetical protein